MNVLESDYRNKLIALESELVKQRERVTAIVEEKEKQLLNLQQHYFPVYQFSEDTSTDVNIKKISFFFVTKRIKREEIEKKM